MDILQRENLSLNLRLLSLANDDEKLEFDSYSQLMILYDQQ